MSPQRVLCVVLLVPLLAAGCSTTPRRADVRTAVTDDTQLRNKLIEVHGWVRDYDPPQGDEVRTWNFVVEDEQGEQLRVYVDDRDAEDVAAADRLVRLARTADAPLVLVGYLRTGKYRNVTGGPRLELREVRYKDEWVRLGPRERYDPWPYPYPYYDPFWGPYYAPYYHPFYHHPYHWH